MKRTEYLTKEAGKSAINHIEKLVQDISQSDMDYLTARQVIQYLNDYKRLIEKDIQK